MNIPVELIELVNIYFKNYHFTYKWFYVKNPGLGYMSPYQMLKLGKDEKLKAFIIQRLEENQML